MRHLARLLVLGALASACARPAAPPACSGGGALAHPGRLTAATDLGYPPFAMTVAGGDVTGFDVDVLRAVAGAMGLRPVFANRALPALVPGVLAHDQDVAASGLRDTPDMVRLACLTQPYAPADLALVVPARSPIGGPGDLAGKILAVEERTRAYSWARTHYPSLRLLVLPTDDDVLGSVRSGDAAAGFADEAVARYDVRRSGGALRIPTVVRTGEHYVLVVAPDRQALAERIDRALARLETSGRLEAIRRAWLGH